MTKLALIAVAAVLSTSAASAADLTIAAPQTAVAYSPASAFNWSGFYAGANFGYGFGWADLTAGTTVSQEGKGILGGVQAGYNYDFGGFVLGAEGDFQFSDIKGDAAIGGGIAASYSLDRFGTVRARAGLPIDRFLPFVTGGLALGNGKFVVNGNEENKTLVGWALGAGAEYAVTDNVTLKAEYLYTDFGTANYFSGAVAGGIDVKAKASVVRAGLNFKF